LSSTSFVALHSVYRNRDTSAKGKSVLYTGAYCKSAGSTPSLVRIQPCPVLAGALAAPLATTPRRFRSSAAFCCSSAAARTFPRFCGSRSSRWFFLCRLTARTLFCRPRFGAFNNLGDPLPNSRNDRPAAAGGFSCESTNDSAHDRADRAGHTADRSAGHGAGCLLRDWRNLDVLG
jgi:hypothetical protein